MVPGLADSSAAVRAAELVSVDAPPPGVAVLGGTPVETLFPGAIAAGPAGLFARYQAGPWTVGRAAVPAGDDLAAAASRLYAGLLQALGRNQLCRVWNYVPRINQTGADGLERYRAFCLGRSVAFEQQFGADFRLRLPASSAVGTRGDELVVVCAAAEATPRHLENPAQVPAYRYPAEHGPRPPSFSRATVVGLGERTSVFIAGTASIRGHRTVAPRDVRSQTAVTLDNLRLIAGAAGLGGDFGQNRGGACHLRIYLRHAADLPTVAGGLPPELVRHAATISFLHADICRGELDVEIEATVLGVRGCG